MVSKEEKDDGIGIENHEDPPTAEKSNALAQQAAEEEHTSRCWRPSEEYPTAILWSVLLSTSIIMEGYDIVLVQSFYAQPSFTRRYGDFDAVSGGYQISAPWQAGLSNAVSVGTVIGAFANGYFTHQFGYRRVLLASLVWVVAAIFLLFFAPSLPVLLVGELLCGIPWGVFATMAPAYASEVCPMALRGYLTVYVNLCWAFGQLIAAGVLSGFSTNDTEWSYRIPFAVQWAWPIPLFLILFFAPESPWYYVRVGRYEDAERSVARPSSSSRRGAREADRRDDDPHERAGEEHESGDILSRLLQGRRSPPHGNRLHGVRSPAVLRVGHGRHPDLFLRSGWAANEHLIPDVCGRPGSGIRRHHHLVVAHAYVWPADPLPLGLGRVDAHPVDCWVHQRRRQRLGGRQLRAGLDDARVASGLLSDSRAYLLRHHRRDPPPRACATRASASRASCTTSLRSSAMSLTPSCSTPPPETGKARLASFWGGCSFLFFVWTWFRLPEMKGKTYEELDILFSHRTKTRDFGKYSVNAYAEGDGALTLEK